MNEIPYLKGRIITPGAIGVMEDGKLEIAFPTDLPIKIIAHDEDKIVAMEPHGKTITFKADDVQLRLVDETWWNAEWERHSNPTKHRWDLVEIIKKHGSRVITDWETGPLPCKETQSFFSNVLSTCKEFVQTDDIDLYNAVVDLTLLTLSDSDVNALSQDYIDATIFTIYNLLICQRFTKSGIDWLNLDQDKWLNSMKSLKE